MAHLERLYEAILNGDSKTALAAVDEALLESVPAIELVNKYMVPAMDEVGRRFDSAEYFVPELLLSARAMKLSLEQVRPLLALSGTKSTGHVIIGTVKGDLHDIGKNLVSSMLEGAGFEVLDLGTDVSPERFVEAAQDNQPDLIAMSALLTTTMPAMKITIEALKEAGIRENVTVLVGGAPVTDRYARTIGADGFGASATGAVAIARSLIATGSGNSPGGPKY
jgi:5-methyltetrahydrofolate--homocysteine methyltransferase